MSTMLLKPSYNIIPTTTNVTGSLPDNPITKNSMFGKCTAINETYFVYISSNEKIRIIDRHTGSSHVLNYHDFTTSELVFNPDSDLLASCDVAGIIKIHNLESRKTYTFFNPTSAITYSSLSWHPQDNILAAIGSNNTIFTWNIDNLFESDEGSLDIGESYSTVFEFDNEITDLYYDSFLDLYAIDITGRVFQIVDEKELNEIEILERIDADESSSIFFFEDYLILSSHNNSKIYVYQKNEDLNSFKQVQTIELGNNNNSNNDSPNQISFLPNSLDSSLLFITNSETSIIQILHFSQVDGIFTYYEAFKSKSNIIYHSIYWDIDSTNIEIFCHLDGSPKHIFSQYIYSCHFSDIQQIIDDKKEEGLLKDQKIESKLSPNNNDDDDSVKSVNEENEDKNITNDIIENNGKQLEPQKIDTDQKEEEEEEEDLPKPVLLTPSDITSEIESDIEDKDTSTIITTTDNNNNDDEEEEEEEEEEEDINEQINSDIKSKQQNDLPLLTKVERLITSHIDKLHHRLRKEQIEREKQMVDKIQSSLSTFCKKQAQIVIDNKLNGTVEIFAKSIQEGLKQQIAGEYLIATLKKELYDHFTNVLGPAVENTFRAMFKQINESFDDGISQHFQQLQEAPSVATDMQTAVDNLSLVCDTIVEEMNKSGEEELIEGPKEKIQRMLTEGDYTGAFTKALVEESVELLFFILSTLEDYSEWHGSVENTLILQIILRIASDLSIKPEQQIKWMNDLLAYVHLTPQIITFAAMSFQKLRGDITAQLQYTTPEIQEKLKQFLNFAQFKLFPQMPPPGMQPPNQFRPHPSHNPASHSHSLPQFFGQGGPPPNQHSHIPPPQSEKEHSSSNGNNPPPQSNNEQNYSSNQGIPNSIQNFFNSANSNITLGYQGPGRPQYHQRPPNS